MQFSTNDMSISKVPVVFNKWLVDLENCTSFLKTTCDLLNSTCEIDLLKLLARHMYDNAGKHKLYFVTGPPSPHLPKAIVKSIVIITKWFLGKLYYMVQNEVDSFLSIFTQNLTLPSTIWCNIITYLQEGAIFSQASFSLPV